MCSLDPYSTTHSLNPSLPHSPLLAQYLLSQSFPGGCPDPSQLTWPIAVQTTRLWQVSVACRTSSILWNPAKIKHMYVQKLFIGNVAQLQIKNVNSTCAILGWIILLNAVMCLFRNNRRCRTMGKAGDCRWKEGPELEDHRGWVERALLSSWNKREDGRQKPAKLRFALFAGYIHKIRKALSPSLILLFLFFPPSSQIEF